MPPGERVVDFEEYTRLYRESWSDPTVRWLLSTVSTAMIFDDHDVHDDWNISAAWLEEMRATDWWDEHVLGALMSYWVYQHIGNLAPEVHRDYELLARVKAADDGAEILRGFADGADRELGGSRWSYCRDLGNTRADRDRLARRTGARGGRRDMVDDAEWDWIVDHARGDFDHLLIATSLPFLLGAGMHYVEAWSEAVAGGAWGGRLSGLGEQARQALDLEHWAAFQTSFAKLTELLRSVAAGERGKPPASIVVLSGDVHHAYLFEIAFRRGSGARAPCGRLSARPTATPRRASGGSSAWGCRDRSRPAARSPRAPGSRSPTSAGGWATAGRGSTISWPR